MELNPAISHVYAEGLIGAAERDGKIDAVFDQADDLLVFFHKGEPLRTFLESPRIRKDEKHSRINSIFEGRLEPLLVNLIHLMLRNNRVENLADTLQLVYTLVEEMRGIVPASVTTAIPLNDEDREKMQRTMEERLACRLAIRYRVDPKILGGVIFKYRDRLIDGSLRFDVRKLFSLMMGVQIDKVTGGES